MISVFIDETSDSNFRNYFGICCAAVNANFYPSVTRECHDILPRNDWDPDIEFKGSLLFSAKQGDISVPVDKRVDIARDLIALNKSNKNARIRFHYFVKKSDNHKQDYIVYLPSILEKALPNASKKGGKDLVSVHCDNRSDLCVEEIRRAIIPVIHERGFALYEDIVIPTSRFETVGILYADVVGYLQARVETISSDTELFENIEPDHWNTNGKLRKFRSSTELLKGIKELNIYRVKKQSKSKVGKKHSAFPCIGICPGHGRVIKG